MYSYLASPYSHPDEAVKELRYLAAERATVYFLKKGFTVFSPIVHSHTMAIKYQLPGDADWWEIHNLNMLVGAYKLLVLNIPGVKASKGVRGEYDEALRLNKKVELVQPALVGVGDIVEELLKLA